VALLGFPKLLSESYIELIQEAGLAVRCSKNADVFQPPAPDKQGNNREGFVAVVGLTLLERSSDNQG
jgi:hypothetical protein